MEGSMVSVRYCDVPAYLQQSGFYSGLDADDEETLLSVPSDCFKPDDIVRDLDELAQLLKTVVFWSVGELPESVLEFCAVHHPALWKHVTAGLPLDCMIHHALTTYFEGTHHPIIVAINTHRREIVRHWMKCNPPTSIYGCYAIRDVASTGNLEILRELHQRGYPWAQHVAMAAIEGGHLQCLQYMHFNGCKIGSMDCDIAAASGQLACLRYLHEQGCPWRQNMMCDLAAKGGHLDCLMYAHEQGCPIQHSAILESSNLACVRYALENGCPFNSFTAYLSIIHEQPVERLQLLREFGVSWHIMVSQQAFEHENLEAFKFVLLNGCPYDENILLSAVAANMLEFVRFLVHEMHLEVSESIVQAAGSEECRTLLKNIM